MSGQPESPPIPAVTREYLRETFAAVIERALWDAGSPPASEAVLEVAWPLLEHAQAAEAKLAEVRAACRSIPSPIANRILAITGSEEPGNG